MVPSERSATTRAATSASSTIDAVERHARLTEDMTESLVLQHEILLLLPEAFGRFKAIYTAAQEQELYIYCIELVQQGAGLQYLSKQTLHTLLTRKRRTQTFSSRRMFLALAKWLRRTTHRPCNVERAPATLRAATLPLGLALTK